MSDVRLDGRRRAQRWGLLILAFMVLSGCSTGGQIAASAPAEQRWLLIKSPRFGDVRNEPEYVWVEEDKLPTTITTLVLGKSAIIAPPEIVAKYGPPPGGGKISPRQTASCRPSWVRMCESGRQSVIPIVHPVTGEVLGVLDDTCAPLSC